MDFIGLLAGLVVGLLLGGLGILVYARTNKPNVEAERKALQQDLENRRRLGEVEIENRRKAAEKEVEGLLNTSRQEARDIRKEADQAIQRRYDDLAKAEERIDNIRASQDTQLQKLENREQNLNKRQSNMDRKRNLLDKREEEFNQERSNWESSRAVELEKLASMTQSEAREQLIKAVEAEASQDMARVMREVEERARDDADERARKVIVQAMQRVGTQDVAEQTTSVVQIPSEEMKGRIIGRNGRNIRAFEQAAGVDIVVDDTPEAVAVSSFDSVRREVARRALEKLIGDGRIHPARIEKTLSDARKEVDKVMIQAGKEAALDANIHGLHREIIKMMGRLKFRTSFGQNQLHHSIEASKIAALLAAELGADVEIAKLGGFLHDIGKAMDHDQEGTHAMLGADFIKRFNISAVVENAVRAHHHEVDQETTEAIIVEIADAISGARPGARRDSLENYIKRVKTLEDIAHSFKGVESAYALQAGREIRILVHPDKIDDLGALRLSKEIARTIEDSMQYPGQIQVTVIREMRAVGTAK